MLDAARAAEREPVGVGPPDAHGGRAERERLDHVRPRPDARVEQDRPPARGRHYPREAVERREPAVGLPPAVVGAVDRVGPGVQGAARVIGVADALEDQRQFGERPQPRQVVPGERVAEDARPQCHGRLRVLLWRLAEPGEEDRVGQVVRQAMAAQLREVAGGEVPRPPAGDPRVERDHDPGETRVLRPAHEALREFPVGRRVQLEEPGRVPEPGSHLLQRVDRQRRGDHRHPGASGGGGRRQVAVPVLRAQSEHADRREQRR
jgi:hypothetical protein